MRGGLSSTKLLETSNSGLLNLNKQTRGAKIFSREGNSPD